METVLRVVCAQVPEGDCWYQFAAVGVYHFSSGVLSAGGAEVSFGVTVNVDQLQSEAVEMKVKVNGEHALETKNRK